ncbi:septum formation inhibitor MinC [Rubellimicrobium rubrum]|uniref:Probable septum site-determining protein MinC n=1 Tax=Rubellimicrobium rubrum TaxID=2585369 RepID=A0A5C4MME3_9RHOB|nr:septum site-determining protein MinC [Rubellimicrobium rubrum]TNC46155.1 septum formation inhibitor MinC [Rubellimicrobium rubrum]
MQSDKAKDRSGRGVTTAQAFQFRGRFFTALALRLADRPDEELLAALDTQLRETPQFFAEAPVVIDLEQSGKLVQGDDLLRLVEFLRGRKLSVFGIQNGNVEQTAAATGAGLIVLSGGRDAPARTAAAREESRPAAKVADPAPPANRVITTPVRSGQTVVADQGDLVIVGPVSSGAELIASGNIHVYGHMRGRALAGVYGDESARIFCQSLEAELLSIAGLYRTSETLGPPVQKQSVQVFLQGERLCVEALGQPHNR